MENKKMILGLSISMITFLSGVLWIKEFDVLFYVFTLMLYIFSLMVIWKYERGKFGGIVFFILLTVVLCFSLYNKNNKNTYVNIAKQREKAGKIYLYEIDLGIDDKLKYYRVYKRTAFLPFFITKSKEKFSFFGEYEKIIMEKTK